MRRCEINTPFADEAALRQFVYGLPASFLNGGTVLWDGRNKIRAYDMAMQHDGGTLCRVVVKRFKHLSLIQKIVYAFRRHKAQKAYRNGLLLVSRGFDTPMPIAFVELRRGLWLEDAYYICGSTSLPCIEGETDRDDWNASLATDFGAFVARLHDKGVLHHDLNDTNVLFERDEAGHYRFEVIDINRMKFYPESEAIPMEECIENLTRFTGRIDLFDHVIRAYAKVRGFDVEAMSKRGVAQKLRHDRRWRRRKRISRFFKRKNNKNIIR